MAYLTPRGDTRSAGSSSARILHDRDRTSVDKSISFTSWRHQDHPISIKAEDRDGRITLRFVETVRSSLNGGRPRRTLTARSDHPPHLITDRTAGGGLSSRSRSDGHGEERYSSFRGDTWSVQFQSDGVEDSCKNTTIAVRSNLDCGAIESRSWILHRGIDSTIFRRRLRWITDNTQS